MVNSLNFSINDRCIMDLLYTCYTHIETIEASHLLCAVSSMHEFYGTRLCIKSSTHQTSLQLQSQMQH